MNDGQLIAADLLEEGRDSEHDFVCLKEECLGYIIWEYLNSFLLHLYVIYVTLEEEVLWVLSHLIL